MEDRSQADAEQPLQFLPINRPDSPPQSKKRRAYQSCEPCRRRKCRCVPDKPDQRQPCKRCVADGQPCDFRSTRSVHRSTRSPASVHRPSDSQQPASPASTQVDRTWRRATEDAPAAPPAPAAPIQVSPAESSPSMSNPTARSRIISAQLHNTADALDLLTFTAAGERSRNTQSAYYVPSSNNNTQARGSGADATPSTPPRLPRDPSDADWERFVLIKTGILAKHEVVEYLDFYFDTLWSLRPIVPPYYRDKSRYVALTMQEPLLVVSLVTLSSRYHPLSGPHGEIRSERIHWQAWKFFKRYLQSALWGSPHTRSPGAIAAMLLLIEWHSKAINNPAEFDGENYHDLLVAEDVQREACDARPRPLAALTSQQRYGMATLLEDLNIVAPAYRSNKMSWILVSTAIALAQEGCCFDYDLQHLSSLGALSGLEKDKDALRQQWNQLICVFIYLADEHLAMRLGLNPLLPEGSSEAVRNRFSTTFASLLPDSALWESYYDLHAETRKARTLFQSLKKAGWPTTANVDILPDLEHIERGLSRWRLHHAYLNPSESKLLSVWLDLEYHYSVMYSFAPANYALHNHPTAEMTEQTAAALSRLDNQASQASHQMLSIVINVLEPSRLMKYLPVRCWLFLVAANLHLLKSTLTANPNATESDDNIRLLRASIMAIRGGSPDDTHMAVRYARFLEIMLNASLHSSRVESPAGERGAECDDNGGGGVVEGNGADADNSDYSTLLPASAWDNMAMLDFPYALGNPGDPFQWWDGTANFGRAGAMGFQ